MINEEELEASLRYTTSYLERLETYFLQLVDIVKTYPNNPSALYREMVALEKEWSAEKFVLERARAVLRPSEDSASKLGEATSTGGA